MESRRMALGGRVMGDDELGVRTLKSPCCDNERGSPVAARHRLAEDLALTCFCQTAGQRQWGRSRWGAHQMLPDDCQTVARYCAATDPSAIGSRAYLRRDQLAVH